jgi:hypothetical protein
MLLSTKQNTAHNLVGIRIALAPPLLLPPIVMEYETMAAGLLSGDGWSFEHESERYIFACEELSFLPCLRYNFDL